MKRTSARSTIDQNGFTIIELMIATLVFSIILLVITVGVINFTRSYYRGINTSTTQGISRSAIDNIAQAIQFTGSQIQTGPNVVCVGNQQYSYRIGKKLSTTAAADTATKVLYETAKGASCTADFVSAGKELLGTNMRLASFTVTNLPAPQNNLWTVSMRIAYGDIDLLCNPSIASASPGGCGKNAAPMSAAQALAAPNMSCRPSDASQFCSISALSTTVVKRMLQ